jgi:hypothetical protein
MTTVKLVFCGRIFDDSLGLVFNEDSRGLGSVTPSFTPSLTPSFRSDSLFDCFTFELFGERGRFFVSTGISLTF